MRTISQRDGTVRGAIEQERARRLADSVPDPEAEIEKLGLDIERLVMNPLIDLITDDPILAEGTRQDIRERARQFASLVTVPGDPISPIIWTVAKAAVVLRYEECLAMIWWLQFGVTGLVSLAEQREIQRWQLIASKRLLATLKIIIYVKKLERCTLEQSRLDCCFENPAA